MIPYSIADTMKNHHTKVCIIDYFYFVLFPFFSFLGVRNVDFSNSGKYIIALFTDSNSTISIYETATQNLGEIVIPNYVIVLFFVSNCII